MASGSFKVRGIVLKSEEYKDKDRMVTLLTPDYGVISVCAKGCTKIGSKSAFLASSFMLCELEISISHGFYYYKDGIIIESNSKLYDSLETLFTASHISDALIESVHQTDNSKDAYELAVYAFYVLANNKEKYSIICSAFNWRLLNLLGLAITYNNCSSCNETISSGSYWLNITDGSIYCEACAVKKNKSNTVLMSSSEIEALNYFASAPLNKLFNVKANDSIVAKLKKFTFLYLSHHFERQFDAMDRIESALTNNPVRRVQG